MKTTTNKQTENKLEVDAIEVGKLFSVNNTVLVEVGGDTMQLATCYYPIAWHNGEQDHKEAEANAMRIVKAVNNHDALVSALKDAHQMLNNLCDSYCRDKDGYLKDNANEWSADLDIRIINLLKKV